MFVHDFAPLDVSFRTAQAELDRALDHRELAAIVASSWNNEIGTDRTLHATHHPCEIADIEIRTGRPIERDDAVSVPLSWESLGAWVTPLDGDLELARFGERRSHLHIMGRSRLAPGTRVRTALATVEQRLVVVVVRSVLTAIAARVEAGGHGDTTARPR